MGAEENSALRPLTLIRAPSNLGLRPPRSGAEPGVWRAPEAMTEAGLVAGLAPRQVIDLPRPAYSDTPQPGTGIRNGTALRSFNLILADAVSTAAVNGAQLLVVGGDCSILLGVLAGLRRGSDLCLVHIDGHSDFRHPGNYDVESTLGSAGGMDLALATGRGERILTHWPDVEGSLVRDDCVVQIGEREGRDIDWAWPDVLATNIRSIDIFTAKERGPNWVLDQTRAVLDARALPFWVHFDVDVFDQSVMPAVDSPGSPGLEPEELEAVMSALLADPRSLGLSLTIFDPDLDPDGRYAKFLTAFLTRVFSR